MHELCVVFYVIDAVEKVAKENEAEKINSVTLEIGEVSSVIVSYLEDCWNWAIKKHELMTDCKLVCETIEAVTFCENCKQNFPTVANGKICPYCSSEDTYLIKGNEFNIKEIEIL
jgi:hydrogenase nickel incorporation protein HypA/HybF